MATKKLQIVDSLIKQAENADTLDGKHAEEFALASDVSVIQTKVGDTAVSEQISSAIDLIDYPVDSVNGKTGAVQLTASDVGALPSTTKVPSIAGLATENYVDTKVAGIVNSAPETLDTLNELAAALGDDPNFATTVSNQIGTKVDKVDGMGLSSNDFTDADKTKLNGIATGANKTTVDSALSSSSTNPVQNKVVNSAISSLNTLVGDSSVASQISNAVNNCITGLSVSGKTVTYTKGDGSTGTITTQDTNTTYSNMTGATSSAAGKAGLVPAPAAGKQASFLRGDGTWVVPTNTTYSAATTSAAGLMSAADKTKLNGIATGANAYSLPTASSSTLGGVKTTSTVTSTSGLTACPIISGVPYYKDTNTTYSLSSFGITATAAELNKLDGVTATATEINYIDGVTSAIQTQLNGKQATITGGASTIASSNLTASRALVSNSSGKVAVSAVTSTELGYLDGVTSNVQTQLNGLSDKIDILSNDKLSSLNVLYSNEGVINSVYDGQYHDVATITAKAGHHYLVFASLYHSNSTAIAANAVLNGVDIPSGGAVYNSALPRFQILNCQGYIGAKATDTKIRLSTYTYSNTSYTFTGWIYLVQLN